MNSPTCYSSGPLLLCLFLFSIIHRKKHHAYEQRKSQHEKRKENNTDFKQIGI